MQESPSACGYAYDEYGGDAFGATAPPMERAVLKAQEDVARAGAALNERRLSVDVSAVEMAAQAAAELGKLLVNMHESVQRLAHDVGIPATPGEHHLISPVLSLLRRGDRLVADLQAYAGAQSLVPAVVELLPLLCSMADLLRQAVNARIDVTVTVSGDCPPCHVDPHALEEALYGLIQNACDAMPGKGWLSFAARLDQLPDGTPAVALSVIDSGTAMTPDNARRAALPFFTTKQNDPLAGMGLAAVEGFVRQSGGALGVSSAPGRGTTVTLVLPAAGPAAEVAWEEAVHIPP